MTFQHLLDGAEVLAQNGDPSVSGVEYDSRRVQPGCVFVAMRGETSDGNRFIDQAIKAGAVAIVTDSPAEKPREDIFGCLKGIVRITGDIESPVVPASEWEQAR